MKTFLMIYGILFVINICIMAYEIKHAEVVPQDIDIYEL